jgi:hypothetical protein
MCESTSTELGGISGSGVAFEFLPTTRRLERRGEPFFDPDPVEFLRDALSSGRAFDDGATQFRGRPVKRIRFTVGPCPQQAPDCPSEEIYAYVDPETLKPAAIVSPQNFFGGRSPDSIVRFRWVDRYLIYEYLPRTEDNLALTDIWAQHPYATGPRDEEDR